MLALLIVFMSLSAVSAFAIGSSYWSGNPYSIAPGESGTVELYMQNQGDEDVTVMVSLKQGSEVARIVEGEITVPAGTDDDPFPVSINVPSNASVGDVHKVVVSFVSVGEPGSGTISLGVGYDVTFDVVVIAQPTQAGATPAAGGDGGNTAVWISLVVLVVLVIVVVLLVRRKK